MKKLLFIAAIITTTSAFSQCACCAGSFTGASNGDANNGILTLNEKQFVVEAYADYRTVQSGEVIEDEEKLLQSMFIGSVGARYGITDEITISGLIPYVQLHTSNGNDKGVGDLSLLGTFRIHSKNNFSIALQEGVELPTGIQKNSNFDNTTVVIGSGSYDPITGIIISKKLNKFTIRLNVLYKFTTQGFQQNYYGSVASHNASVFYNLKTVNACYPTDSVVNIHSDFGCNLSLGYYGEWLDKIKEDNVVDENSGYYAAFANIGTILLYKKWSLPVTISLPIISQMNGSQNNPGYRLRIGIIKSF